MELQLTLRQKTRVRFFRTLRELASALEKEELLFVDAGVPALSVKGFTLPAGESGKRWSQVTAGLEWLHGRKAERASNLVAIGGGAALDTAALTASLYRRGMGLVLVPTTLLAMVDATLGGKTAVDHSGPSGLGKNFAGTFYPAREVWICLDFLRTLDKRERVSGAGEVWKTLWLAGKTRDQALLDYVGSGKTGPGLKVLVESCLRVKAGYVKRDPLDTRRIRESLNYGHTLGHALESLSAGRLPHGECVLWGMAAESGLLGRAGRPMSALAMEKIRALGLALPFEFEGPAERWLPWLRADKKNRGGMLELTVLASPGKPRRLRKKSEDLLRAIRAFPAAFRP